MNKRPNPIPRVYCEVAILKPHRRKRNRVLQLLYTVLYAIFALALLATALLADLAYLARL
jgi:hypothetical protein